MRARDRGGSAQIDNDLVTEALVAAHLPVVLWSVVGHRWMGGIVGSHQRRMDFVRFTGEWCLYYVLIALGVACSWG